MARDVTDATRVEEWGPVSRGFQVLLPDGQRGSVQDIRLGDDGVELLVETGLFVRRVVTVGADDVEAILPRSYQIVIRPLSGAHARDGGGDAEALGGIVRLPVHRSPRTRRAAEAGGVVADPNSDLFEACASSCETSH